MPSEQVLPSGLSRQERQAFAQRRMAWPVALVLGLGLLYAVLFVLILTTPLWAAIPLAIVCGVVIGMLFITGHDAAHNSLTSSTRVNKVLGRLAFLPSLHAFSLWDLSHNRTHHRYNSIRGIDYVWEPMTLADYGCASAPRRTAYRFCRTPVGVWFYYLFALWAPRLFVPIPAVIGRPKPVHVLDGALVLTFLGLLVLAAITTGALTGLSGWASVLLAIVLPFLVWSGFMSFVIFLHHTHPSVAWYADEAAWTAARGSLAGTACVRFPFPFDRIVLGIMEHNAHHLASGVPLYNVARMQRLLEARGNVVTWRFSWRAFARICRRCKLYDYEAGRWTGFDGIA